MEQQRRWWKGTYAQFRWSFKSWGWRYHTLMTPPVWRWPLYLFLRLFPSGPWWLGVRFGRDEDGDLSAGVSLLIVELGATAQECMSYREWDSLVAGKDT